MIEIPMTLEELCDYILENAERIYVREKVDGKWGSIRFNRASTQVGYKTCLTFRERGDYPIRGERGG